MIAEKQPLRDGFSEEEEIPTDEEETQQVNSKIKIVNAMVVKQMIQKGVVIPDEPEPEERRSTDKVTHRESSSMPGEQSIVVFHHEMTSFSKGNESPSFSLNKTKPLNLLKLSRNILPRSKSSRKSRQMSSTKKTLKR